MMMSRFVLEVQILTAVGGMVLEIWGHRCASWILENKFAGAKYSVCLGRLSIQVALHLY